MNREPGVPAPVAEADLVVVSRRYRGPPDSANGGYTCGLLARRLGGPAQVRLHRPPPLERALRIRTDGPAQVSLLDEEQVVASGTAGEPPHEVPEAVDFAMAAKASESFRWRTGHPFPGCFVCGSERHHGDGLCIFPGRVPGRRVVAGPWIPDESVCDASGQVRLEVVWAALDCPSWFGILEFESGSSVGLLGEMSARIHGAPVARQRCVVLGWSAGRAGRKLYGGAALYTSEGVLLGSSAATWIEPKPVG